MQQDATQDGHLRFKQFCIAQPRTQHPLTNLHMIQHVADNNFVCARVPAYALQGAQSKGSSMIRWRQKNSSARGWQRL